MAIISGMEAAKVDDVKPFELPVDALAEGVKTRQGRYDKAKETFATGAAAINFDVRDLEEDYKEKEKIIGEFNDRINNLSESVGGDWSLLDNSQIQAEATKTMQDSRVSHLKKAFKEATDYEKMIHDVEKEHGFALRFGDDASTQSLYDKDGKMRQLDNWSVQEKKSHQAAAAKYFDNLGYEAIDDILWAYSGDPKVIENPSLRKSLTYDFWRKDWASLKVNNKQVDVVINNMIDQFIHEAEGNQYYQQIYKIQTNQGKNDEEAKIIARNQIQHLIQMEGQKRYMKDLEKLSQQDYNKFPEPSAPSSPRGPSTRASTGDGAKPPKVNVMGEPSTIERTNEGLGITEPTRYDKARNILSENVSLEGLGEKPDYQTLGNVHAIGKVGVIVPTNPRGDLGSAKNVAGTVYEASQSFGGDDMTWGRNPVVGRMVESYEKGGWDDDMFNPLVNEKAFVGMLNVYKNGDAYGKPIWESNDLEEIWKKDIEKENSKMLAKLSPDEQRVLVKKMLAEKKQSFFGGGEMASLFSPKFDPIKGYTVYEPVKELEAVKKLYDEKLNSLGKLGVHDPQMPRVSGKRTIEQEREYELLKAKKENLESKIAQVQELEKISNTPERELYQLYPELLDDPGKKAYIKKMEGARNKQIALQTEAYDMMAMDWATAKEAGYSREEWLAMHDPDADNKLARAQHVKDKKSYTLAKADAISEVYGMDFYFSEKFSNQVADLKNSKYFGVAESAVNAMYNSMNQIGDFSNLGDGKIDGKPVYLGAPGLRAKHVDETLTAFEQKILNESVDPPVLSEDGKYYMYNVGDNGMVDPHVADMLEYVKDFGKKYIGPNATVTINHKSMQQKYSNLLPEKTKKYQTSPKFAKYMDLNEKAKIEKIGTGKVWNFNDQTPEGKYAEGYFRSLALQQVKTKVIATNEKIEGIKNVKYGGLDESGKRDFVSVEDINLQSEHIKSILAAYTKKDKDGNPTGEPPTLSEILADEANGCYVGVSPDMNNGRNILNAIYNVKYTTPDGKAANLHLEIELEAIDRTELNKLGVDAYWSDLGEQMRAGLDASGNSSCTIYTPETKDSGNPVGKKYYLIHNEMTINASNNNALHVKPGTFISFDDEDDATPLAIRLERLKGKEGGVAGSSVTVYDNEEAVLKDFEKRYMESDGALLTSFKRIDEMEKDILRARGSMNDTRFEKYMLEMYDPRVFNEITNNGTNMGVTKSTFASMKDKVAAKAKNDYGAKNQVIKTEIPISNGSKKLQVTADNKSSSAGWNLKIDGTLITEKDLKDMSDEEIAKIYDMPGLGPNTKGVVKLLNDKKFITNNGKRYIYKGDTPTVQVSSGNDENKTDVVNGNVRYQFLSMPGLPNKPLMAKKGVPPLINENLQKAFVALPATLDTKLTSNLQVSSGHRSVEDNVMAYKTNMSALTNSDHFYGDAVDISTVALESKPNSSFDGSGYEFLDWLYTPEGETWMKDNKVWIWHHTVTGDGGWHLHIEYNSSRTGLKDDHPGYKKYRDISNVNAKYK